MGKRKKAGGSSTTFEREILKIGGLTEKSQRKGKKTPNHQKKKKKALPREKFQNVRKEKKGRLPPRVVLWGGLPPGKGYF